MPDHRLPNASLSQGSFRFGEVRSIPRLALPHVAAAAAAPSAPLGVLSNFTGEFAGRGFSTIFRPNSGPPTTTLFPNAVSPPPPTPPSENVLELNLMTETLTFSDKPLGSVPNRGLEAQNDI